MSLMAPGPSRQRAGPTATGFYTGAPLLLLPGATYLLPCPPTQQVLQHQPLFPHLSQYLCLHFAIIVDEYFKYSACLPPTNLPARCVPTNKTGATSNATKTVSSPKSQYLVETSIFFVCAAYTLLVVLAISFKKAATSC